MIKRLKNTWIWYVLSVIYQANKWLMFLLVFLNVFIALIPMIQVIAFANLIDTVVQMKQVGFSSLTVLPVIGILILLLIIKSFSEKIYSLINTSLINRMRNGYVMTLLEKHARLEYKYLENPEGLDLFARVMNSPEQKIYDCLMNLIGTISLFITIISLGSTIVYYTWYIGFLLLVVVIPLMIVAVRGGRATYEANKIATKYQRKYQYYGGVLTSRESSLERSLFGYGLRLNDTWKENFEMARKINFKTISKWILRSSIYGIISIVVLAVIIICLIYMTIQGIISIGIFISLINAIYQLSGKMTYELSSQMESLIRNREYISEVKQFLDLTEVDGATHNPVDPPIPFESLQFTDVWFKYPGTDTYILKGLSFLLEKGKHYSFVGTNGSGKSTIIKLIIGLYTEYEGEILLNGKSIREYSQSDLKSICAIAFQDYSCYFTSIHDNIALGNINHFTRSIWIFSGKSKRDCPVTK